tara:strand:- start:179 stop:406 length:228 start_codon:yes stop_codon:yes gene_type:complete
MTDMFLFNLPNEYLKYRLPVCYSIKDPQATHLSVSDLKRIGYVGLYLKNSRHIKVDIYKFNEIKDYIKLYYFNFS